MQISSVANAKVKFVARLQRDRRFRQREGLFVAEGLRWLRDVAALESAVHELYIDERLLSSVSKQESSAQQTDLHSLLTTIHAPQFIVTKQVMQVLSDVETPPGILLVLPLATLELPKTPTLLLIADRIQTPGNMGTLLRTAAAAGVDGMVLTPGCVDVFNPKVVRAAMGAQLRLAVISAEWEEISTLTQHLTVYCASAESSLAYSSVAWSKPAALIIGNEANGPSEQARQLGTSISIPMANATESLNAAMAAGIILFEAVRQRALLA